MPTYEYECSKCEFAFEAVQKLSEPPLIKCPACKRKKLIKLISLPAKGVVAQDFHDDMAKIKKEAKQIAQRIIKGDEQAIADVYGSDAADGKATKGVQKVKTLDQVKGGKIKRSTK
jgi:putative FmdB family regulatory protein